MIKFSREISNDTGCFSVEKYNDGSDRYYLKIEGRDGDMVTISVSKKEFDEIATIFGEF